MTAITREPAQAVRAKAREQRDHQNLVQWTMHPEPGGHHAAHLEPDVLADDIRAFYAGCR